MIPTSAARTAHQVGIMRDYRSTALLAPPSVARALAAHIAAEGIDPTGLFAARRHLLLRALGREAPRATSSPA